jgi:hypothetical protein
MLSSANSVNTRDDRLVTLKYLRDRVRSDPRMSARLVASRGAVPTKTVAFWALALTAAFIGLGSTLN